MAGEHLSQPAVDAIAEVLRTAAAERGCESLSERHDLEPAVVNALGETLRADVENSRQVGIPSWERVGQVDVVVRSPRSPMEFLCLIELKWCGPGRDVLYEVIWDCFKMALVTRRPESPRCYLMRDMGGRDHRLAWDSLLEGGYDHYPAVVPAIISTTIVGQATILDWELRAVEVALSGTRYMPLEGTASEPRRSRGKSKASPLCGRGWVASAVECVRSPMRGRRTHAPAVAPTAVVRDAR
jgi:hypothetical protein